MKDPLKCYWFNNEHNVGDAISEHIVEQLTSREVIHHPENLDTKNQDQFHSCDLTVIGSILDWIPSFFPGAVWGTGKMSGDNHRLPFANITAVRGPRTAKAIGAKDVILGDPGLLCGRLLPQNEEKIYEIGIVPHFVDMQKGWVKKSINKGYKFIAVTGTVEDYIRDISQCKRVVSSSLHGIIIAHSYGVPAKWHKSKDVFGKGFKFFDYFESVGIKNYDNFTLPSDLTRIQDNLIEAFPYHD